MVDLLEGLGWAEDARPERPALVPLWTKAEAIWKNAIRRAAEHLEAGKLRTASEWLTFAGRVEKDWFDGTHQTRDVATELCRRSGVVLDP